MRDIERIERITDKLKIYWMKVPDWRFGQLIENVKRYSRYEGLFYVEDDQFEQILDGFFYENE